MVIYLTKLVYIFKTPFIKWIINIRILKFYKFFIICKYSIKIQSKSSPANILMTSKLAVKEFVLGLSINLVFDSKFVKYA